MEKSNRLLLWFFMLLALSVVSFYVGSNKFSEPIGIISRFIFLISVIAAGVTFIFFFAERIGKKMPADTKRRMLIQNPYNGLLEFCCFLFSFGYL